MQPAPVILIDLAAATPAYRQIVDQIRHLLVTGALRAGAALPSVRRLAVDLGVHHNTVAKAYRTLAEEGWLRSAQGKAVQVVERGVLPAPAPAEMEALASGFERRLRHLAAEMRAQGLPGEWIARQLRVLAGEVE
ncbi:MAG: GntR family transcriptional regulator [Acidobacteria bacterium]|nr:GntR family transcriptional regulator [Acidobacteriota bacterium]